MQIKLEYIVTAIKAMQKAEEALVSGSNTSRAITDSQLARWTLEAVIGQETIAVLEK